MIKLSSIKANPKNPRVIKDEDFQRLIKSIEEFPKMMALRPMVVDDDMMVLGGNQRLKALKHLGYKEVPDEWVKHARDLTEDERRRFIITDNVLAGDWDIETLIKDWEIKELDAWGLDGCFDDKIDKTNEGETLHVEKSLQVLPKKEYILIMADDDSEDWEELKKNLNAGTVKELKKKKRR